MSPSLLRHPRLTDLATVLLGAVMTLTFAPFSWWWLGPLALALYNHALNTPSCRGGFWRGWLFGSGMFVSGVSWIYVSMHTYGGIAMPVAALIAALFGMALALFCGLHGVLYRALVPERSPRHCFGLLPALIFAALWTLCEALRGWVLTGFPWLTLGTAHVSSPLAGYAPLGGVYLVSFVTALSAALLYQLSRHRTPLNHRLLHAAMLLVLWGGGALLPRQWAHPFGQPLTIGLVQGNLAQESKWQQSGQRQAIAVYTQLTRRVAQADVVIWPETALPMWDDMALPVMERARAELSAHTALMSGMLTYDGHNAYNSVVAIPERSQPDRRYVYNKYHLVPFGEYIPLRNVLGLVLNVMRVPESYISPGADTPAPLPLHNVLFGIAICYEIIFPDLVRERAREADVLVTVSNDTWFGTSLGPLQHMQIAQMRALENNRYVVRATSNGLTGVVDATGHIIAAIPQFQADVLTAQVQPMRGQTPFTRTGSWPVLALATVVALVGYGRSRLRG